MIRIVDAIPMTAVGKIFKPSLREDTIRRTVRTILAEQHLAGEAEVTAGGPRGMRVGVTLAGSDEKDASQLQDLLDGYLFQATVEN